MFNLDVARIAFFQIDCRMQAEGRYGVPQGVDRMIPKWSLLPIWAVLILITACSSSDISIKDMDGISIEGRTLTFVPACKRITKHDYCLRPHVLWRKINDRMIPDIVELTAFACKTCKPGNQIISARYSRNPKNAGLSERQLMLMADLPAFKAIDRSDGLIKCNGNMCETWIVDKGIQWSILISDNGDIPDNMISIRNTMKSIIKESVL